MTESFPASPAEVSAAWLSEVLDTRVAAVAWRPIGTGQVGDSARFSLTYADGANGPATLAGKFAAADPTSRKTALDMGLYAKEVAFYRELATRLSIRTPRALAAEVSEAGDTFILLFEDLGPARQGNQLAGCTIADAREAVRQLAGLHAPSWDRPEVIDQPWFAPRAGMIEALTAAYPIATQVFVERYADRLEPELMALCRDLGGRTAEWFGHDHPKRSLVHGDYRLDNMLFDIKGSAEPLGVLDWQTVTVGNGLTDLAYFLGAGVGTSLSAHEDELIDAYFAAMADAGCPLDRGELWDDYRRGVLHGVSTAVFSAAFVERTERGDAMFLDMARGACQLALKHDSLGAL